MNLKLRNEVKVYVEYKRVFTGKSISRNKKKFLIFLGKENIVVEKFLEEVEKNSYLLNGENDFALLTTIKKYIIPFMVREGQEINQLNMLLEEKTPLLRKGFFYHHKEQLRENIIEKLKRNSCKFHQIKVSNREKWLTYIRISLFDDNKPILFEVFLPKAIKRKGRGFEENSNVVIYCSYYPYADLSQIIAHSIYEVIMFNS